MQPTPPSIDPATYRQVLGQYPTGVCVVTARDGDKQPIAMVVGSFTSVSLNPPLVAFFPDRGSSSWAKLRGCEQFCVNILAADQEPVCRKLASKDPDKFAGVAHRVSARGNPVIEGVVAWIECERHAITDAGDHEMVMGQVLDLDVAGEGLPLLFFQGGYGRFAPASLGAEGQGLSLAQLREVDLARPEMEHLVGRIGGRCIATLRLGEDLVVGASAGQAQRGGTTTLVGQRLPFAPPTGAVFAAWLEPGEADRWLHRRDLGAREPAARTALQTVRERGYSVGLLNDAQRDLSDRLVALADGSGGHADIEGLLDALAYDPPELTPDTCRAIRVVSAPVFGGDNRVALALTLHDFPKPEGPTGVQAYIDDLVASAASLSRRLGGPAARAT